MRRELKPILFDDHDRESAEGTRTSIVSTAPRSKAASKKVGEKRTEDDYPAQSFQSWLQDPAPQCRNYAIVKQSEFPMVTTATRLHRRAFELPDRHGSLLPNIRNRNPCLVLVDIQTNESYLRTWDQPHSVALERVTFTAIPI